MYLVILLIIIVIFFLCNRNEGFAEVTYGFGDLMPPSKYLMDNIYFAPTVNRLGRDDTYLNHDPKFWYSYGHAEKTPYSHKSSYNFRYKKYCDENEPGSCLNSRCVFKSLKECQDKCVTGCAGCGRFGTFMCNLQ
jgi:hypothetical protein